jgi:predicted HicB family RNase H-like nuclease
MPLTLEYKGYLARIEVDEDGGLNGRVINLRDVVNLKARTLRQLKREFAKSMKVYFDVCEERSSTE